MIDLHKHYKILVMDNENAPADGMRSIGETQRTADFKHERSGLIEAIKLLAEGMQLGRSRKQGNFTGGPLPKGGLRYEISDEFEGNLGRRVVVLHDNEYSVYEEGEEKAYGPHGQLDLVAHFAEETFDETHKQWKKRGWEIYGDGSVKRLSWQQNEKGDQVEVSTTTNDVLDLIEANEYLRGVIAETLMPEQPETKPTS